MKKIQAPKTLTTSLALLLAFATAYKPIEARFIAPAVAQSETNTLASPRPSSPVSPSAAPSQGDRPLEDQAFPWALMLLLPLLGGLTWWVLKQSRSSPAAVPVATASSIPIAPVVLEEPAKTERIGIEPSALDDAGAAIIEEPALELDSPIPVEVPVKPNNASTSVSSEAVIALSEERLVVDFHRRKIGEVVVRKEIETCIVEVPVRRERLIIEQISPEYEQLAIVDLGSAAEQINSLDGRLSPTMKASFVSINAAIEFLKSITDHSTLSSTVAPISLVLADKSLQSTYQEWLKQHAS
jgi:Domain of unknown function (DUF2382)